MRDHDRDGLLRPMQSHSATPRRAGGMGPSTIPPIGPRSVNWAVERPPPVRLPGGPSDGRLRRK
jgi:hypothetical protein